MNALILAAGFGSRFKPHTLKTPKPAIPFLNIPIMGYGLHQLEEAGLKKLVMNAHHLPGELEAMAQGLIKGQDYNLHMSHEDKEILGSGGGIRKAQNHLEGDGHFLVLNSDEVLVFKKQTPYRDFLDFHKKSGALATLLTTDHGEAGKSLGAILTKPGSDEITDMGIKGQGGRHFCGLFAFSDEIFDFMPRDGNFHIFKDVLQPAIEKGKKVLSYHEPDVFWLDVSSERTYIESTLKGLRILTADDEYSNSLGSVFQRYKKEITSPTKGMWKHSTAEFKGKMQKESLLLMGPESFISESCEVKGFAVIGEGSQFHNGVIENSVVGPNLQIHEMVSLRHQLLL